jgi:uncharacterized phage protein gp47/JayE
MPEYIQLPIETDPDAITELGFDYMESVTGGVWSPADGNLDAWMLSAIGIMCAELRDVASDVPASIFRYMGSKIFGITPIIGTSATATTTWLMTDTLGHRIDAGATVGIRNANDELVFFTTSDDIDIPAGQDTAIGINIASQDPTTDANGLTGPNVELIDQFDFVESITLTTTTANGTDDEDDDDYLDRLTLNMRLVAPRPITASDFALMSMNIVGVARATALDGYDPGNGLFTNARTVSVAAIDSNGAPISTLIKTSLQAYLAANREVNFNVFVIDPTVNTIDVTYTVTKFPNWDATSVQTSINAALTAYLNPLVWGTEDTSNTGDWLNKTSLNQYDLSAVIKGVEGVNSITTLTFRKTGGSFASTPVTLTGVAPIPAPGTLSGTVS